ncbi:hypothetical protein, partial [Enterobacter hormaechei]
ALLWRGGAAPYPAPQKQKKKSTGQPLAPPPQTPKNTHPPGIFFWAKGEMDPKQVYKKFIIKK